MKARVKATEEIVEVMYSHTANDKGCDIIWYTTPRGACFSKEELEFIDTGESLDYWTRLEHTYAGMAMQAYIIASHISQFSFCEGDMGDCKNIARALVEKMKEERK